MSGLEAKRRGDLFERILEASSRFQQLNLIRIPMGAEVRKIKGQNTILKVPAPFDYIIQKRNERPVFFDAKTRTADRITFSDFWNSKSTKRQLETMLRSSEFGTKSGFVVWFRASDRISFFNAEKIANMRARTSLGPDDGIDLGTLEQMKLERLWTNANK